MLPKELYSFRFSKITRAEFFKNYQICHPCFNFTISNYHKNDTIQPQIVLKVRAISVLCIYVLIKTRIYMYILRKYLRINVLTDSDCVSHAAPMYVAVSYSSLMFLVFCFIVWKTNTISSFLQEKKRMCPSRNIFWQFLLVI